jgi:hypothetical protein
MERVDMLIECTGEGSNLTQRIEAFAQDLFGSLDLAKAPAAAAQSISSALTDKADEIDEEDGAFNITQDDGSSVKIACFAACITAPRLLKIPSEAIRLRMSQLLTLLSAPPTDTCRLCLRSPALLLVPWEKLQAKMMMMKRATGLDLQACAAMLTLAMF